MASVQLATNNGWSVIGIEPATPFVQRVDLRVPPALVNDFSCTTSSLCAAAIALYDAGSVSAGQTVAASRR